jgi:hypothetical protein
VKKLIIFKNCKQEKIVNFFQKFQPKPKILVYDLFLRALVFFFYFLTGDFVERSHFGYARNVTTGKY